MVQNTLTINIWYRNFKIKSIFSVFSQVPQKYSVSIFEFHDRLFFPVFQDHGIRFFADGQVAKILNLSWERIERNGAHFFKSLNVANIF
jgi:hypothetical protein